MLLEGTGPYSNTESRERQQRARITDINLSGRVGQQ